MPQRCSLSLQPLLQPIKALPPILQNCPAHHGGGDVVPEARVQQLLDSGVGHNDSDSAVGQRGMPTGCSGLAHGRCICRSITVPCRHHAELLNALGSRHGRLARRLQGSCGVGAEDAICVLSQ